MLNVLCWYLVFFVTLSLSGQSVAQEFHPYYGEEFPQKFKSINQLELAKQLDLLNNSYHIKRPGKADLIADNCQSEKGGSCYRHTQIKYSDARAMVTTQLDLQRGKDGNFIWEVYCDRPYTEADFPGGQGPNPNHPPDHDVLNIEHTWPQSRFSTSFSKELQKGDLHHLYPSDNKVNSQRGSHPFAEVDVETINTDCPDTTKLGIVDHSLPLTQKGTTFFEPPLRHRGNIARALFYFSLRYHLAISATEEYFLRKWNQEDPVDQAEVQRHERIYLLQGNRNPFIDFPWLVEKVRDF